MLFEDSPKWPGERLSKVRRIWDKGTVVCIATGPSLTAEAVAVAEAGKKSGKVSGVIVVNDSYLMAPWADALYFADVKWWRWHNPKPEYKAFAGEKCTIESSGKEVVDYSVHVLKNAGSNGLSVDAGAIFTGSNSGYQAINIAALSGASRILLLGYDCKPSNNKHHWFGDHPDTSKPPYDSIRGRFKYIGDPLEKAGVKVINCTPGSAIDCFQRGDIASVLADTAAAVVQA